MGRSREHQRFLGMEMGLAPVDDRWGADIDTEPTENGRFVAFLVLTPPVEVGPQIRVPIEGEYERPELAEMAALDAFAAMTRRS